jgi:hypothetical protein
VRFAEDLRRDLIAYCAKVDTGFAPPMRAN